MTPQVLWPKSTASTQTPSDQPSARQELYCEKDEQRQQLVTASRSDAQYQACTPFFPRLYTRRGLDTVITLGCPRILLPMIYDGQIRVQTVHVFERFPLNAFNIAVVKSKKEYVNLQKHILSAHGVEDVQVWMQDIAVAVNKLELYLTPVCLLLDTCNLVTLAQFMNRMRAQGPLHHDSLVMLNTDEHRNPGVADRYARELFARPLLKAFVPYVARGQKRTRYLSFYTGAKQCLTPPTADFSYLPFTKS